MNHCVPLRKALRRFDLMFRRTVSSLTLRYDAAWGTVNSSGMFMAQFYEAGKLCCSILQHPADAPGRLVAFRLSVDHFP